MSWSGFGMLNIGQEVGEVIRSLYRRDVEAFCLQI